MILYVLLALFVLSIAHYVYYRRKQFQIRDELGLKGPEPNFFIGCMWVFVKYLKEGLEFSPYIADKLHKQYGETFGWYNGPFLDIATRDPEFAKEVFVSQFSNFVDRQTVPLNDAFPFTQGLLAISSQGHANVGWKDVRSVVSPIFTSGKLKKMHNTMQEQVDVLLDVLDSKLKNGKASLEIYDELQSFTMDTIARLALGIRCDSLHDRNDMFYVNSRKFFAEFNLETSPVSVLFSYIFPSIAPHFRWLSSIARAEKPLIDRLREVVQERRRNFGRIEASKGTDLIQLLLEQDLARQNDEKKAPLSDDIIITNCFHFLLAGYETTSTAMAFAIWSLATHEEVQDRLYAEIIDNFGTTGELDYEKVMRAPYLDCVFKEVLRRYPPVVMFTSRKCINETTVVGQRIPKGTTITVPVHQIHWHERFWDKPMEFIPERFEDPEAKKKITWMPFGIGPRNCVGMRFAEMEFKTALCAIVRKFRIRPQPGFDFKMRIQLVLLRPLDGVQVILESRDST